MKNKVFFGPAGSPVNYKGAAYKAPKYIQRIGLDSYEYQSPYGVRIGEKSARTPIHFSTSQTTSAQEALSPSTSSHSVKEVALE